MTAAPSPAPDLTGKRVMLVGGAGFIGHNLALELRGRGAEVAIVDSLQVNNLLSLHDTTKAPAERDLYTLMVNERLQLLKAAGIPLFVDDARDYHRLSKRFSEFEPNVVVLLSAVSHASRANKDPMTTLDHSFRTLENALDNARANTEHFIFFSSSMVYGNFATESVDEEAPCNPLGIYGAVKLGGEKLVTAYGQVFDLPYTIIRPSALYGERCISRRVGQIFIENALRGRELVIKGDGTDRVDFTYISDLVQGVCLAIREDASRGEIFNMTYGNGRSLNHVAAIVQGAFPETSIRHEPRDALVPERGTLDVSKARELLGYAPQFPIEMGFDRYINWYRGVDERMDLSHLRSLEAQPNE
jgi:nucleoside-diphosphate-sugar epimerase